ncbi:MAG: hypothetical protein LBT93_03930 [Treponema sp.]|jgi:hypothetical protein|nr:hypothetical protein [Treponema sp.]
MKKIICILLLLGGIFFCLSGQEGAVRGDPIDLVVVLDTSAGMSDSYGNLRDYLVGPFLSEFLRIGDTFHLISFSDKARIEIARRIEGIGDVETIIGRMFLMYPLDPSSDITVALRYTENYVNLLPTTRQKKVLCFSGGAILSGNSGQTAAGAQDLMTETASRFSRLGAEFQYVAVPLTGRLSSGRPPMSVARTPAAANPGAAAPPATSVTPPVPGPAPTPTAPPVSSTAPLSPEPAAPPVREDTPEPAFPRQPPVPPADLPSLPPQVTESPEVPAIPAEPSPRTGSAADVPDRTFTTTPERSAEDKPGDINNLPFPLLIGFVVLAVLLAVGLIIFFVTGRLHRSPNRVIAHAALPRRKGEEKPKAPVEDKRAELFANYAATQRRRTTITPRDISPGKVVAPEKAPAEPYSGALMLSLFVEDQNAAIGRRNIHTIKAGYTLTIGGGTSDFLIFLVPIPPNIAEIRFDGRQCTFIPRKSWFFPDIGSEPVPNCIGKTIRIISAKNYELHIRLERYEDPLIALNRLLQSVSVPG